MEEKTDAELAIIVLSEAHKSGDCLGISKLVIGPQINDTTHWEVKSKVRGKPNEKCDIDLEAVVARLRKIYSRKK